jgi:hypothetical protein
MLTDRGPGTIELLACLPLISCMIVNVEIYL